MSLVIWLSGPESSRAKTELALEDAGLHIFPPDHYAIGRKSFSAEHCQHLPMVASGPEPDEDHGFVAVLGPDETSSHSMAQRVVEPYGWVLRIHHELPPEPEPNPVLEAVRKMQQRIDELEARLGITVVQGVR